MKFYLSICICFLSLSAIYARPQQINWGDLFAPTPARPNQQQFNFGNGGNRDNGVTTTTAAPAASTPSPQYLACLQRCPSTMEYNPVCGSDGLNYHNTGRLQCSINCGLNVAAVRMGTCRPL